MNTLLERISGWLHHPAFTALLVDSWMKSVAVLAIAGCVCWACQRAAAATRHWIWFLALASLPCLLLLSAVPRAWHRPMWPVATNLESGNQFSIALSLGPADRTAGSTAFQSQAAREIATSPQPTLRRGQPVAARFNIGWLIVGFAAWLTGALLSLGFMLVGQFRLTGLARNASGLQTPDWALLLQEACERLRLRRPVRLLQSRDNPMPLTWGWWRPVVLLPAEAAGWPIERRRIVLLHELAHVRRRDCLTQSIAQMVCVVFWLNPLAWLAARRMCVEREGACDDLVLNSGCKATDYASHLVEIARAFRRAPQYAGIAMARSPELHGRIAAIVDANRARRLRPLTALASAAFMGALALSVSGRPEPAKDRFLDPWENPYLVTMDGRRPSPGEQSQESALRQQQIVRLQQFAQAKERQSQELAAKAGEQISPQFQAFFNAATSGDWRTVTNRYAYFKLHHGQYSKGTNAIDENLRTAYWQPVLEICLAYDQVVNCDPKYTAILADGIITSIPAGSIYFGGTDPGRGVPTAFCKSHVVADPFFTLTQNALADGTYLEYLRAMYGGKIYTPTGEDSQRCFQEYMNGAMRRLKEHKLKPGEDVKMTDNRVEVSGQVAVMAINGLLTKVIFDENPSQEFYIEESFPLDWMYPYLEPHGLILKINREPLAQLPDEVIARDREYWRKLVASMLGDWLNERTTAREVVDFVERVHIRHDFTGFTGDPSFVQNDYAKRIFSKLRSSVAGIYAWRLSTNAPVEYQPPSPAEMQALTREADLAFRQAFALCPYNPEALFRYVDLLLRSNRVDDAVLITKSFVKLDRQNRPVQDLLETLKRYKAQQSRIRSSTNTIASLYKPAEIHTLTATEAEAFAVQLANEKAQALYQRQPFQRGRPAELVYGYWVWHDGRALGTADLEATVKFKADGSQAEVNVILLVSRPIQK